MWGITVNLLLHFSNDVFITGINLFIHTTLLIGICLACRSVVKRNGRKAATQSVVLRVCLVAALLSPLTLALFTFTGMKTFYLSTTLLNPHDFTEVISQKIIRTESFTRLSGIQKTKKAIPRDNTGLKHPAATSRRADSPVKDNESIKPATVQGNKLPELTSPGYVEKNMEDLTGRRKTAASPKKIIPGLAVVFTGLWCVFSMFLFVRFIAINLYIRRIRQLAEEAKPEYIKTCRKAAEELGIKPPAILQSRYVHSTMVTGFFKPSIILPAGANEIPMASREVFLHELAHLARRDYLWNQLGQVCKIILPFQPLIWILAHLIEEISDYVCDDYVVKFSTVNRPYAAQLFNLALSSQPENSKIQIGAGIVSAGSPLRRRIERILDNSYARHIKINANEAMSITLLFVCSITFTGFIGVDRPVILPHSKYVTRQSKDEIKTPAGNLFTVKHYPETPFESEHFESQITDFDSDKEHEHTNVKKSAKNEDVLITEKLTGYNHKQETKVSHIPQTLEIEKISDIVQVNDSPAADTDKTTEKTKFTAEAGPEIENIDKNSTPIQATELGTVTMIVENQNLSSFASQNHIGLTGSASISSGEIDKLALKTLDIVITYDFENADITKPEEKMIYDMYRSLENNKLYPVWSPDGSQIVITDRDFAIWMVPVMGGEPELIYRNEPVSFYDVTIRLPGIEPLCFAPGGRILTYKRYIIDEDMGTEVIIDNSTSPSHVTIMNPVPVIETLDIETGRTQVIAKGAAYGRWSSDGRFFMYSRLDADSFKELMIRDINTGQEYPIDDFEALRIQLSPNDRYLMFSEDDLFMIPGTGGLRRFRLSGDVTFSDVSRDAHWILYTYQASLYVYDTHKEESTELFPGRDISPSWARFSPDLANICFSLESEDNNWDIYLYDFGKFTGLTDVAEETVPQAFELKENYPNPFNASTTIQFSLPERERASMVVYNVMGQRIRELISGELEPGMHSIVWDSRDDSGRTVGTGTYIAQLTTGIHQTSISMSLVK